MSTDGATTPHAAAELVAEAMAMYERGDLDTLATLVHPDAEIEMLYLGGAAAHGPDGVREALAQAREGVHRPTMAAIESLGPDAAIMIGRIQYETPRGGLSDRKAAWLTVLRDGLLWRSRVFGSEEEARSYYDTLAAEAPGGATRRPSG